MSSETTESTESEESATASSAAAPASAPAASSPGTPPPEQPPRAARKLWLAVVLAVVVLGGGAGAYWYSSHQAKPKTAAAPHVKIGLMAAFSGGSSNMGYGEGKGVQLAKKQLGAENIEVVQEDSQCDKTVAPAAIKRLIAQGVVAIIGDGCSSASFAALPQANTAKVLMISPSASSPKLSIADDYFFRVVPPDTFQGAFVAKAMYDKGIRTAGIFYTDEPYGEGMNTVFKQKFEALGGKVVAAVSADPDVIDLKAQIDTVAKAKPQAVFFAANSVVSTTAAIKLTREAGITAPLFGADIAYDTTIVKNAGAAAEGLTITSFPTGTSQFRQSLVNEYQVTEQLYGAAQAYDAFHALYLATQKGATTGEQIKNALPGISFDGVSAHMTFDKNGEISDPSYKYDLMQVKEGAFVKIN